MNSLIKNMILLVFLTTLVLSQIVTTSQQSILLKNDPKVTIQPIRGEQYNNQDFLKTINNYFGCRIWNQNICVQCSNHFYFNDLGVCCQVKPQCKTFNRAVGICQQCYQGYSIQNGQCTITDINNQTSNGCKTWSNGKCTECSQRWYFNLQGQCQQISDLCRTWQNNGQCQTCYNGYILNQGVCIRNNQTPIQTTDINRLCSVWSGKVCLACAERAFFDSNGICRQVNINCATWDKFDGMCLSCYNGFQLKNGQCSISNSNNGQITDPGCKIWDWNNKKCVQCSAGWFFNQSGKCTKLSDNCKTFDSFGVCTLCYNGYDLIKSQCVLSQTNNIKPQDLGCKTWDWNRQICTQCSARWTFNSQKKCVPVSDNCRQFDNFGLCINCYPGYDLKNGICVFSSSNNRQPSDLGCKTWDWNKQICIQCSSRWFMNSKGSCVAIQDTCSQFDNSGNCLACFKGYDLVKNQCILSTNTNLSDLGCKIWDWNQQICKQCSLRWIMNSQGKCLPLLDNCKLFDKNGLCVQCYNGYNLINKDCIVSSNNQPSDLGCKTWDLNKNTCLQCSFRWVFNSQRICVPMNDNCRIFDSNGVCTGCYSGYDLKNGQCIYSSSNNALPSDLGCKTWNWNRQLCIQCSARWTFNSQGKCVQVSDNCKAFDKFGLCTSCYKGYDLTNGQCIFSSSNVSQPSDVGCKTWDWNRQICTECSLRWFFNTQGKCSPIPDNCNNFDRSGNCLSCYQGYELFNKKCQVSLSNSFCKTLKANGQCGTCYTGYVLYQNQCTPISKLADIVLYYAACCPEKLAQLKQQGRL